MQRLFLWLIPLVLLGALVAAYLWPKGEAPPPPSAAVPAPAGEPAIRYPVQSAEPTAEPLPALAASDEAISAALAALFSQGLPGFLVPKNIVHRFVATVDNLPRDHLAPQLMPVKPVRGIPLIEHQGERIVLNPKNAARYQSYVSAANTVPTDALIAAYARFYPLLQEQYEKLGYPDRYFNDRMVEVIDHLLATPEVAEPLALVQPEVLYEFADPKLETLSAGQKILLRVGKTNRDKLKSKLKELRQALVSLPPAKE
jgi:hypothetical protein